MNIRCLFGHDWEYGERKTCKRCKEAHDLLTVEIWRYGTLKKTTRMTKAELDKFNKRDDRVAVVKENV